MWKRGKKEKRGNRRAHAHRKSRRAKAGYKNKGTGTFSVFFKAQDVDRVYSGLEKCVEQFSKSEKRRSLHDRLEDAKRESQARNQIEKNSPEKEVGRGKEER